MSGQLRALLAFATIRTTTATLTTTITAIKLSPHLLWYKYNKSQFSIKLKARNKCLSALSGLFHYIQYRKIILKSQNI